MNFLRISLLNVTLAFADTAARGAELTLVADGNAEGTVIVSPVHTIE